MDDERRHSVRTAIMRHLDVYPDASDTVEGIRGFWLSALEDEADPSLVESVLDALVSDGVLWMRRLRDGGVIFGLKKNW
ncbi:MAG: hypothetical protein EHM55_00100 [Acidobacteria bacterium]|nr:MAG: hypothetical protein EHM55_00100 [Acidobacteriota bacterium]